MTDPSTDDLDDLLAHVARQAPAPSDRLMARVMADAARAMPRQAVPAAPQPGRFASWLQALGGWPTMGGLVAAGVAGLWIGVAPPASLENLAAVMLGTTEEIDLLGTGLGFDLGDVFDG